MLNAAPPGARVLVVDDHAVFAESLAFVLDADPGFSHIEVVGSLADARTAVGASEWDLVLVDVRLGDGTGLDLVEELATHAPRPRVLVLTAHPRADVVARAREAGAEGLLAKGSGLDELIDALRNPVGWPDVLEPPLLSPRELEVVNLLAAGHDVRGIAKSMRISVHTVRDHVKNLLVKLDAPNQLGAVLAAHRAGLISLDGS
ncbi:response regulator transcription factor [Nocardioides sp. AE5]|uniref:response regulator transcription factor n=1 Tax=Nocardioides sp. AE5 TaxID=2962573 RepID=UPI002881EF60|nr:response regulator transcription factor [Nocardioides sp. AE5]MDT0200320.1 response regulator transcription factor [Nocardioides sp. AE5]